MPQQRGSPADGCCLFRGCAEQQAQAEAATRKDLNPLAERRPPADVSNFKHRSSVKSVSLLCPGKNECPSSRRVTDLYVNMLRQIHRAKRNVALIASSPRHDGRAADAFQVTGRIDRECHGGVGPGRRHRAGFPPTIRRSADVARYRPGSRRRRTRRACVSPRAGIPPRPVSSDPGPAIRRPVRFPWGDTSLGQSRLRDRDRRRRSRGRPVARAPLRPSAYPPLRAVRARAWALRGSQDAISSRLHAARPHCAGRLATRVSA